ncbi:hypothetical protein HDU88_003440 [Geranomyces variabilis]|nr:hypothetical protein HDU88_003440 [Geranomyces variabilis]
MSIRGKAFLWMDAASKILMGSHLDRVVEALFMYNAAVSQVQINVEKSSNPSVDQCRLTRDAVASFLIKSSIRGCGGGRDRVTPFTISLIDSQNKEMICYPAQSNILQRRSNGVPEANILPVDGQTSGNALKLPQPRFNDITWRPVSDVQIDLGVYGTGMTASYTSVGSALIENAETDKSRTSVDQSGTSISLSSTEIVSGYWLGSPAKYNPGPIFYGTACAAQTVLAFTLRVPQGHFLSTTLRRPELYAPRLEAITSPLLLSVRDAITLASPDVMNQVVSFNCTPAPSSSGFDFYDLNLILNRPVLGQILLFFSFQKPGDTTMDLVSKLVLDACFICGSTGRYLDGKVPSGGLAKRTDKNDPMDVDPPPPTINVMVWNVAKDSENADPWKRTYLNKFAAMFDIAVYVEQDVTVVPRPYPFTMSLGTRANALYEVDTPLVTLDSVLEDRIARALNLIEQNAVNKLANMPSFIQKAPEATVFRTKAGDKKKAFAIVPVHWKASASKIQQKVEQTRLIYVLENLRIKHGVPIIVVGDFNQEEPYPVSYGQGYWAGWIGKGIVTGAFREFPTIDRPTKMSFQPKKYDFIWSPFSKSIASLNLRRSERSDSLTVTTPTPSSASLTVATPTPSSNKFCFKKQHRTMSVEFSDHHPIAFRLSLPLFEYNGQLVYFDLTLVSFNLRWFKWDDDNPFNVEAQPPLNVKAQLPRERDAILRNYLEKFDVVALQEVSVTASDRQKLNAAAATSYVGDSGEPIPSDTIEDSTDPNQIEINDETANLDDGKEPSIHKQKLSQDLSPRANGVFSTFTKKYCFNKILRNGGARLPDLRICLLVQPKSNRGVWVGSVHDSATIGVTRLVNSEDALVHESTRVDITAGCNKIFPVTIDGTGREMNTACKGFPLIIAGDWNPLDDQQRLLRNDTGDRIQERLTMANNVYVGTQQPTTFNILIVRGSRDSALYLSGTGVIASAMGDQPSQLLGKQDEAFLSDFAPHSNLEVKDFAFYCGYLTPTTAIPVPPKVTVVRARVDQWMVGVDAFNSVEDDCETRELHDYAGPYEGSGCTENIDFSPGLLDRLSDHRAVTAHVPLV